MIIQIGTEVDESRILWKYKESDEWERADIDDLIKAYESRPKGKWITKKLDPQDVYEQTHCSECNAYWSSPTLVDSFNYCPNCGAKMKGRKNE